MRRRTLFVIIATTSFFTATWAQTLSAVQNQNHIQQEQQRLMNEEFLQQKLKNALQRPQTATTATTTEEKEADLVSSCINIQKILVTGNDKVSDWAIKKVTKKYQNTCMGFPQINQILNEITDIYIKKGYITSRAFLPMPQTHIKKGILEIRIVEGKISKFEGLSKRQTITAFPFLTDSVLNLRDIEQGIDQLNRLASNSAIMEIKPDDKNEYSKIEILNEPKDTTRTTFFTDNAGLKSTGETRFGVRATQDNLLGLNEQINMSFAKAPSRSPSQRNADYLTIGASIPFGYWTLNDNFSWSDYRTSFLLYNGDRLYFYGNSINNNLNLDRLLARGQSYKISANAGVTYKRNQNYTRVLDLTMKNEVSSRDLAIANLGLSPTFYFEHGVLYLNPTYNKGTKWFGALKDNHGIYDQSAQYEAWKLYVYGSLNLFDVATYHTIFDGQYTKDELYGTETYYLGGEYSVRGFRNEGMQGDSGYSWRNDISFNVATLAKSNNKILKGIDFGPFIDYGYVRSNHKDINSEILSGAGGKISFKYRYFDSSISYANVLKKPKWINENEAVYLYAGFNFSFN